MNQEFVVVGKIGAPFGIAGWHHIQSFTDPIDNLIHHKTWYIQSGHSDWRLFELSASRRHQQALVAKLKGVDDRNQATILTNAQIAIKRETFSDLKDGEFYWTDLEGLEVVQHADQVCLGKVSHLYRNASLDVMVVKNEDKELHIPFQMGETIIEVDLSHKKILIDWEIPG